RRRGGGDRARAGWFGRRLGIPRDEGEAAAGGGGVLIVSEGRLTHLIPPVSWREGTSVDVPKGCIRDPLRGRSVFPETLAATPRAGLDRGETLLRKCVRGVGALETSLRPPLLARAGLAAALRWFAEQEAGRGVALTLELPLSLPRAAAETEQDLFDSVAAIV